jgi:Ca2+-binding RTX toxin-like protein
MPVRTMLSLIDIVQLGTRSGFASGSTGDLQDAGGSPGNDVLVGDAGPNQLFGDGGNDWLFGLGGADLLDGGAGQDKAWYDISPAAVTIDLGAGTGVGGDAQGDALFNIEDVVGSAFSDALTGDANANQLIGLDGNDILRGNAGADYVDGGSGEDWAYYDTSSAAVTINLTNGAAVGGDAQGDILASIENVVGSSFADTLIGDAGANRLVGFAGNDLLSGLGGGDVLDGGSGRNTAVYDASPGAVIIDLINGIGSGGDAQGDTLINIQDIIGSAFGDTLVGNASPNELRGGGGDDWLFGGAGGDLLDGGAGTNTAWYDTSPAAVTINLQTGFGTGGDAHNDVLIGIQVVVGSAFADALYGDGNANQLKGGDGNDVLVGGGGADLLDGGAGENWAYYDASPLGVSINLAVGDGGFGDATGDVLRNIQDVVGSRFGDRLVGDANANTLIGGGGDDFFFGGAGGDLLVGNTTRPFDTASYAGSPGGVQVNLRTGAASGGDAQGDSLIGIDNLIGGAFDDELVGHDNTFGSDFSNTLDGGGGADRLTGGGGPDSFIFRRGEANGDVVTDLTSVGNHLQDRLAFIGYGPGATFTQIDSTHWQINYDGNTHHEVITFLNAPVINPTDVDIFG